MDAQHRIIEDGAIAIQGDHILAAGPRAEILKAYQSRRHLDRPNAIMSPGLINTHTHAAMSLFRGIADDLVLQDWLERYIFPAEAKNVSPDFVRWGTRLACLEMLLSGTTTFTDMYYFEDVVAERGERSRDARRAGRDRHRLSGDRRQNSRRCPAALGNFPSKVGARPADCPGHRAARAIYEFPRDANSSPRAGQQI